MSSKSDCWGRNSNKFNPKDLIEELNEESSVSQKNSKCFGSERFSSSSSSPPAQTKNEHLKIPVPQMPKKPLSVDNRPYHSINRLEEEEDITESGQNFRE